MSKARAAGTGMSMIMPANILFGIMGSGFRGASQVARQRKLGLFHAFRIADGQQGLAAFLVIFWAFLGILASVAGCAPGRLAAWSISRISLPPFAGGAVRPNEKPANLAGLFVFGSSEEPSSEPVL
jgi:hypothetical protein